MNTIAQLSLTQTELHAGNDMGPQPASRESIARFEQSFNAPDATPSAPTPMLEFAGTNNVRVEQHAAPVSERITQYTDKLSENWEASQAGIQRLLATDHLSPQEVLTVQYQFAGAMFNVEIAARVGGMSEQGIQTMIKSHQ